MSCCYVLGGGLAGLLTAYKTNGILISAEVGGQLAVAKFPLGPRILEETEETTALLKELEIYTPPTKFKVGYLERIDLATMYSIISAKIPEGIRDTYFKRTRGEYARMPDSAMSGNKSCFVGWDMKVIRLTEVLASKVKQVSGRITAITDEEITILSGQTNVPIRLAKEDKIINTLPLPAFLNLYNKTSPSFYDLLTYDTVFCLVDWPGFNFKPYSYLYYANDDQPFHRINVLGDGSFVLEVRGDRPTNKIPGLTSTRVLWGCQIVNSIGISNIGRFLMVGRYAQWEHGIKAQHVLRRVKAIETEMGAV